MPDRANRAVAAAACLTGRVLTEINLVVGDLAASHRFYTLLGWTMRAITLPGDDRPQAWLTVSGPAPVTLHSQSFASWWDTTGPQPSAGSTTIDLTFDDQDLADRFLLGASEAGGTVVVEPRDMPWGQRYAIVADPDGYRWGLKSPIPA